MYFRMSDSSPSTFTINQPWVWAMSSISSARSSLLSVKSNFERRNRKWRCSTRAAHSTPRRPWPPWPSTSISIYISALIWHEIWIRKKYTRLPWQGNINIDGRFVSCRPDLRYQRYSFVSHLTLLSFKTWFQNVMMCYDDWMIVEACTGFFLVAGRHLFLCRRYLSL